MGCKTPLNQYDRAHTNNDIDETLVERTKC